MTGVPIVEADNLETASDQLIKEAGWPVHELRAETHDEENRGMTGIPTTFVGDIDARRANCPGHPFVQHTAYTFRSLVRVCARAPCALSKVASTRSK